VAVARRRSRLFRLIVLAGLIGAGVYWWRRTRVLDADLMDAPSWPPLDVPATPEPPASEREPSPAVNGAALAETADAVAAWVAPDGEHCPADHPVKATKTGVYHVPGGQFYGRASAERCYTTPAAAEADGYRASKR
jgi:hypothetical protein